MAYNYEYPYTDSSRVNDDWLLSKMKELLQTWSETDAKFQTYEEAWIAMRAFITDYFDNLNVQTEIDNKLNALVADGTLSALIAPFIYEQSSPIVVDSITEMTDHSKMYVLSSSGVVYYWKDDNWTASGIVYGQLGKLTDLENAFDNSFETGLNIYDGTVNASSVWKTNAPAETTQKIGYWCTGLIKIDHDSGLKFRVNKKPYRINFYDSNKDFISEDSVGYAPTITNQMLYIGISFENAVDPSEVMICYTNETAGKNDDTFNDIFGDKYIPYTKQPKEYFDHIFTDIRALDLNPDFVKSQLQQEAINASGTFEASDTRVRTDKLPIDLIAKVYSGACVARIAFYRKSGTFISLSSFVKLNGAIPVEIPTDAVYAAFSFAVNHISAEASRTAISVDEANAYGVRVYLNNIKEIDTNRFFDLCKNLQGVSVVTDANGINRLRFVNTARTEWFNTFITCKPMEVCLLEFRGQCNHIEPSDNYGTTFVIEFMDKDHAVIGSKYNMDILGETRCGYHRYGAVAPLGTAYARLRMVSRTDNEAFIETLNMRTVSVYHSHNGRNHGHLGMIYSAPRNTLPAFELSKIAGFTTVVTNVNVTQDGVLVALHDNTINATSDGTGYVYDYDYEDLLEFDFGSWFSKYYTGTKIPKFEDVISYFVANSIRPALSLHGNLSNSQLVDMCSILIRHGAAKNILVKSFDLATLEKVHSILGDDPEYLLDDYALSTALVDSVKENYPFISTIEWHEPVKAVVDHAIEKGFKTSMYFGNDLRVVKNLIKNMDIQGFCVDTFSDIIIPID